MCYLLKYTLQFLVIALVVSFISKKEVISYEVLTVAAVSTVCLAFIDKLYYPIDRFEPFDQTQKQALIDEFQQYIDSYKAVMIDDRFLVNIIYSNFLSYLTMPTVDHDQAFLHSPGEELLNNTYSKKLQDYLNFFKGNNLTKETISTNYKNTLDQVINKRLLYLYTYLGKLNVARSECNNACSTLDCKNNCNNKEYDLSSDVNDFYRLECKIICPSLECKNACDNKIYSTRTELGDIKPLKLSADKLNKELNSIVDLNKNSIGDVKSYFTDWTERMFQLMYPGENLIDVYNPYYDKLLKDMYDYNKNKT